MPPDTNPLDLINIMALVSAIGLSGVAGLRACLTLFAVGLAGDLNLNNGKITFVPDGKGAHPLLQLSGNFHVLGSEPLLIVLAILAIAEFVIDKVPGLDHLNDIIHTVVRPIVGAVIMAGTANSLSDINTWGPVIAAVVGFLLALGVHSAKSGTRLASTATTVGVANPVLSVGEDVLTVSTIVLAILFPIVGLILAVGVVLLAWRLFSWIFGRRKKVAKTIVARDPELAPVFHGSVPFDPLPFLHDRPIRSSQAIPAPYSAMNAPTTPDRRR
ncbi:MAG TPA: DUF4126 domain-containing protein [Ktedonobacterales bacterium]|nr:DUF4126 domain-containing protein [Ktedonobacterales bacterium]